mmetsp:Transcript_93825/g.166918  ORF Transcript_93825/g.166918 Transcript_93825/m.166918 type:complete len:229 (+) Transcript_93825:131-817(+)
MPRQTTVGCLATAEVQHVEAQVTGACQPEALKAPSVEIRAHLACSRVVLVDSLAEEVVFPWGLEVEIVPRPLGSVWAAKGKKANLLVHELSGLPQHRSSSSERAPRKSSCVFLLHQVCWKQLQEDWNHLSRSVQHPLAQLGEAKLPGMNLPVSQPFAMDCSVQDWPVETVDFPAQSCWATRTRMVLSHPVHRRPPFLSLDLCLSCLHRPSLPLYRAVSRLPPQPLHRG